MLRFHALHYILSLRSLARVFEAGWASSGGMAPKLPEGDWGTTMACSVRVPFFLPLQTLPLTLPRWLVAARTTTILVGVRRRD